MAYIDEHFPTNKSPESRLHLGDSMGGIVSTYVALERPDTFKLVGSQSGAFWTGDEYGIKTKFRDAPDSYNLKVWFSAGTYEPSIYFDTKEMEGYAREHGWETEGIYLYEGHSWGSWRHTLDDMFSFFFPAIDGDSNQTNNQTDSSTENGDGSGTENKTAIPGFLHLGAAGFISVISAVLYKKRKILKFKRE